MKTVAVIVAGGIGVRAAKLTGSAPKQFRMLAGRTVIDRAMHPFLGHPAVDAVLPVIRVGWEDRFKESRTRHDKLLEPVPGGEMRQDSVRLGLEALASDAPQRVLIHDAARPFVKSKTIDRVLAALETHPGAIPALTVSDTLKKGRDGFIAATLDRENLFAAQTPQGFDFWQILQAHRNATTVDRDFTDDASIAEWADMPVALVEGDGENRKLTRPEDFEMAERLLAATEGGRPTETRTGTGYDVHRFGPGDRVMLCGISIPHDRGLLGHSDADVGLHALTDALFGAIADGDIGSHFPPGDPQWKAADSAQFLRHAADLVADRGGRLVNLDITIICERPKIGPHREAMRTRIADILAIDVVRVSVKATTSEGLGFAGRQEGIAAQATATISQPVEADS